MASSFSNGTQLLLRRLLKLNLTIVILFVLIVSMLGLSTALMAFDPSVLRERTIQIALISLFTSLIVSSVVLFIVEYAVKNLSTEIFVNKIASIVRSEVDRSFTLRENGLIGIHERLTAEQTKNLMQNSKEFYMLQTYSPNMKPLVPDYIDFVNGGGKVKFLILSPKSQFVEVRSAEIGESYEEYKNAVKGNMTAIDQIRRESVKAMVHARSYVHSPGICIHGNERTMFVGHFLQGKHGIQCPHMEIEYDTELYNTFIAHFNKIWEGAEII